MDAIAFGRPICRVLSDVMHQGVTYDLVHVTFGVTDEAIFHHLLKIHAKFYVVMFSGTRVNKLPDGIHINIPLYPRTFMDYIDVARRPHQTFAGTTEFDLHMCENLDHGIVSLCN